jgi:HAD superfamily hydrolase (TIGR01509 family)
VTFPAPVRAVVFDMDGLLIDTERVVRDAMFAVASEMGREFPLEVFLRMVGLPDEASRAVSSAHFGDDFDHDAFEARVWARVRSELALGASLKTGVIELLDAIEGLGLPCAVATSSSRETVRRHLSDILDRFATIVAAGDYARGKPHPDPFLVAAERLGVDPAACLALEDSHNGVRAAHAAGMMTIMVPDLLEATDEMRGLCLAIAATLHEVRAMLAAAPASRPT